MGIHHENILPTFVFAGWLLTLVVLLSRAM